MTAPTMEKSTLSVSSIHEDDVNTPTILLLDAPPRL
jgi:hypothetical protein